MADIKKVRSDFLELLEDLDPEVECVFPAKAVGGSYTIELSRAGEKQAVKLNEKDLLAMEEDEEVRQKIEEKVLTAIEKLPDAEDGDEEDIDDEEIDEDLEGEDEEEEDGEDDGDFDDEEEEGEDEEEEL